MSYFKGLTLTKKGEQLQAKVNGNLSETLVFTKAKLGSGTITNDNEIRFLTDLKASWGEAMVSNCEIQGQDRDTVAIELQFSNQNLREDKIFREIGLYARGNNGQEVLYAYANAGENYDYIPVMQNSPHTFVIVIYFKITSGTKVSATIDLKSYVTQEKLNLELNKKIDKTSISSSLTSTSTATVLSSAGAKSLEDKKLNIADSWKISYKEIGNTSTSTDLNDIKQVGKYNNPANANLFTNTPAELGHTAFILDIESIKPAGSAYTIQTIIPYNSIVIHRRTYRYDRGWSNWERIDGGDRLPLTGGTVTGNVAIDKQQQPFFEVKKNGTRHMLIGLSNSGDDDSVWSASNYGTNVMLKTDRVQANKPIYVNGNKTITSNELILSTTSLGNVNLDTLTTTGVYLINSAYATTANNVPEINTWGTLEVVNVASVITQTFTVFSANRTYKRGYNSTNKWHPWIRVDANSITWDSLAGKPNVFNPAGHTHSWASLTGKPNIINTVDSTSTTDLASARAVKLAYDRGSTALTEAQKKENAFSKNTGFNKNFGTAAGTVLEGDKINQITGKTYGGILNTAGTKTAGLTYFDNNTKKLYLCKITNTNTSANTANFIPLDNNSILERLENLPKLYMAFVGFANFLNGTNITIPIPSGAKYILILENLDNHLPYGNHTSGSKKVDVATFKASGLRVKGETQYYYENNTIKAKRYSGDWADDVCVIYFEY